jgi:tRNA-Thr(GGU) m(6)t(6)A37 methyltransferase TsaA
MEYKVTPIGYITSPIKSPPKRKDFYWQEIEAEIVVEPRLALGLNAIESFSHVIVIWWMDKATDSSKVALEVVPRGRKDLPLVGVFASRSPYRPNPVGKATVRLLEHRGNILRVKGLDALDGTPVLDIKPFIPDYDSDKDATAPEWTRTKGKSPI